MNVAIVGSRGFTDSDLVRRVIVRLFRKYGNDLVIISGGASGADSLAAFHARELCIPVTVHLPDWEFFGKSAGYKRNELIVADAGLLIAFYAPGRRSRGTSHSVEIALDQSLPVHIYHEGVWTSQYAFPLQEPT